MAACVASSAAPRAVWVGEREGRRVERAHGARVPRSDELVTRALTTCAATVSLSAQRAATASTTRRGANGFLLEQLREEMESGVAFEETNNMGAEDARSVFTQHAPVSERTAAWLDGRRRRGWMDERKVAVGMVDAERRSVRVAGVGSRLSERRRVWHGRHIGGILPAVDDASSCAAALQLARSRADCGRSQ